MTGVLIATDLDGTVIFSERALAGAVEGLVPVDVNRGQTYAYMTRPGVARWERLVATGAVTPVTTRNVRQYLRLRLPGPPPHFAVVSNGGQLLVDGERDVAWERAVRDRIAGSGMAFDGVWARVSTWEQTGRFTAVRAVEDFFAYAVAHERDAWLEAFAAEAGAWAGERGWRASLQGRKLYVVPESLDKAAAVRAVAERCNASRVVAGGDSVLDLSMLEAADAAIRPAHGELHTLGWRAAHCRTTRARGAAAGDEILEWYLEQAGAGPGEPRA
jgi:hypothetical protein